MSQFNPSLSHGNLPYQMPAYGLGPHKHPAASLMAVRDTLIAAVLSGLLIAGVNIIQQRQPAVFASAPLSAPQAIVEAPAQTPTVAPVSKPAALAQSNKPDSEALQALLDKWQAEYPNAQFGVVIKELGGDKRSASLNADTPFEGASLYKLYLADYLYTNIADKNLSLTDHLGSSRSIGKCLDLMIVYSDNECGESIGYTVGWANLQNFVRNSGFSETTQTPVNTTTASDMAKYLQKLQNGSLISSEFSDDLLANMREQVYRSAIPAGETGVAVADKVGIKKSYWHDAAIVYGANGTYILVVLSNNSGSAPIKDLAQRVDNFMGD